MRNSVSILLVMSGYLFAGDIIERFNLSTELIAQKKFSEAVKVLEKLNPERERNTLKEKFYYQRGTLYCILKKKKQCQKDLKKAYVLNSNNQKTKKNLELSFGLPKKEDKKKNNDKQKSDNDKKATQNKKFEKKFSKQLLTLKYSEQMIHKKQFGKKVKIKKGQISKDW